MVKIPALRAGVLLLLVMAFTPPAHAFPYDITNLYYDGCGSGKYEVGWWHKDCSGFVESTGTTSAQWKVIIDDNCPDDHDSTHYFQWCGGAWVAVSQSQFDTGCSCA